MTDSEKAPRNTHDTTVVKNNEVQKKKKTHRENRKK